jgi:V/A-type H+-transporting ATPase subunit I
MPLQNTQTFLLSLENKNPEEIIKKIYFSSLDFETLNPQELGGDWSNISFFDTKKNSNKQLEEDIKSLEFVLNQNQQKGFLNVFIDNRMEGSLQDLDNAKKEKEKILGIVKTLQRQNEITSQKQEIEAFIDQNPDKKILFGKNLDDFVADFNEYVNDVFVDTQKPEVQISKLNSIDAISFSESTLDTVKSFITEKSDIASKLQTSRQVINALDKEYEKNSLALQEFGITTEVDNLEYDILKKISALHAALELDLKIKNSLNYVFSLSKNKEGGSNFVFITTLQNQADTASKILEKLEIPYQKTDWNQKIYDWQNNTGFRAFQSVAQSIGTIDEKESDPTNILGVFFMIFFAFCLNDALYGLLLSIFTGYFLFLTKVKEQFRNMFSLFFYSGLTTFLFGILTNSWAGDFFNSELFKNITNTDLQENTSVHNFLSQFQVIDVLNPEANLPINNFLNGVSPIIFMLMVSVVIGFLVLLSSYILRITTAIKRSDYSVAFGQIAWIFFLSTAVSYFILNANNYSLIGQILLSAGIISLLIFNQAKTFAEKILGFLFGPRGLYGIIQMGADLMSFTRIVAIGLTGGVIANIVNLLAGILYTSTTPAVGIILAIIMLFVGHTFNLVLSLFGAYINPIRLTYVEFMPKFFLGEGRQIQKFSPNLQYFRLVD